MENLYEFRELCSKDIFPMFKILNAIGFKEFKNCFTSENVKKAVAKNSKDVETIGITIVLDIAGIVIQNIGACENDIYKMLASVSNLSEEEIKNLPIDIFAQMIIDFAQKPEFKDFFKVVSRLFK